MEMALDARFFQVGYVCRDLERGMAAFDARLGGSPFLEIDVVGALGVAEAPITRLALAYLGPLNVELIEVRPDCGPFFTEALRDDEMPGFHHLGYLVDVESEFLKLQSANAAREPMLDPVMVGKVPGAMQYFYVDERQAFGHYLEYIYLEQGGKALFDAIPKASLSVPPHEEIAT